MRIFKIILATSFLIFLFLPLSQCSSIISKPIKEGKQVQIEKVTADSDLFIPIKEFQDDIGSGILVLITFLVPLITSILRPHRNKLVITNNVIQILATCWLGFVIFFWVYGLYSPLLSGRILFLLVVVFLVSSLYTLIRSFGKKYNNYEVTKDVAKTT